MGWTSGWYSRQELTDYLVKTTQESKDIKLIQYKATCFGKHLWLAVKNDMDSYIILYLLSNEGGDWGYKGISEDMGPSYFDCPSELLDLTTGIVGSKYSDDWRNKMGEIKRKSKIQYKIGDIVEAFGMVVKIIGRIKRSYKIEVVNIREKYHFKKGAIYRATAKDFYPLTNSIEYIVNE